MDYRLIKLTRGQFAKVDAEDFEELSRHRWLALRNSQDYYAARTVILANSERRQVRMHRLIMGLDFGNPLQVDHINHDTLDNRRSNLRIVTISQQCMNRRLRSDNKSGHKGLWDRRGGWTVRIKVAGKSFYVGQTKDFNDAVEMYREAALKFHGEFAKF